MSLAWVSWRSGWKLQWQYLTSMCRRKQQSQDTMKWMNRSFSTTANDSALCIPQWWQKRAIVAASTSRSAELASPPTHTNTSTAVESPIRKLDMLPDPGKIRLPKIITDHEIIPVRYYYSITQIKPDKNQHLSKFLPHVTLADGTWNIAIFVPLIFAGCYLQASAWWEQLGVERVGAIV